MDAGFKIVRGASAQSTHKLFDASSSQSIDNAVLSTSDPVRACAAVLLANDVPRDTSAADWLPRRSPPQPQFRRGCSRTPRLAVTRHARRHWVTPATTHSSTCGLRRAPVLLWAGQRRACICFGSSGPGKCLRSVYARRIRDKVSRAVNVTRQACASFCASAYGTCQPSQAPFTTSSARTGERQGHCNERTGAVSPEQGGLCIVSVNTVRSRTHCGQAVFPSARQRPRCQQK